MSEVATLATDSEGHVEPVEVQRALVVADGQLSEADRPKQMVAE